MHEVPGVVRLEPPSQLRPPLREVPRELDVVLQDEMQRVRVVVLANEPPGLEVRQGAADDAAAVAVVLVAVLRAAVAPRRQVEDALDVLGRDVQRRPVDGVDAPRPARREARAVALRPHGVPAVLPSFQVEHVDAVDVGERPPLDPPRVRRDVDGFEGPHQHGLRAAAAGHLPLELAGREGQLEDRGQRAALACRIGRLVEDEPRV